MTLGAIASIGTNIWVSPHVQRSFGDVWSSILGCLFALVGVVVLVHEPLSLSLAGLMITYLGMAISGSAVASGTANLTATQNRSTVMMSVKMLKTAGAVTGPILAGTVASIDCHLPFAVAASSALVGAIWQLLTKHINSHIHELIVGRRTVGLRTGLLKTEEWQDEYGTPPRSPSIG